MYPSIEVRWFYKGQIPQNVLRWFQNLPGEVTSQPRRVDHYLKITSDDSLGVKIREGRIEVKQRTHLVGETTFHPQVSGLAGGWRKWAFALTNQNPFSEMITGENSWIPVEKTRQLRRYSVKESRQVLPVSLLEPYTNGCELELTILTLGTDSWWTLCFEAYGTPNMLSGSLESTVLFILNSQNPPRLESSNSYSYPHWLLRNSLKDSKKHIR